MNSISSSPEPCSSTCCARLGQLLERRVDVEAVVPGHALEQREGVGVAPVPALDRAAGQLSAGKATTRSGSNTVIMAQAVAGRAGADRRVEREQARLELGQRVAADRAGELAARTGARAGRCSSISSASARPSAMRSAASKLSARRCCSVGVARTLTRSITTSMSCFSAFFSFGSVGRLDRPRRRRESARSPAPASRRTARRTRPCGRAPPAPAPSAACRRGSASTASTIWLTLCACSGRSWSGQYGVPARANSRRR